MRVKILLRQILVAIEPLKNNQKLSGIKNQQIEEILKGYEFRSYQLVSDTNNSSVHIQIRYLIELIKQIPRTYIENNWKKLQNEIIKEYEEQLQNLLQIIQKTKLALIIGLENLKKLNKIIAETNYTNKKDRNKQLLNKLLQDIKIPVCISRNITKNIIEIKGQQECNHYKFKYMNELMSYDESNNQYDDINGVHANNIKEFVQVFGRLAEVKQFIEDGEDNFKLIDCYQLYAELLQSYVNEHESLNKLTEIEKQEIMKDLDKNFTREFYAKVFPLEPTCKDTAFYARLSTLQWITYDHLGIKERTRIDSFWDIVQQCISQLFQYLYLLIKSQKFYNKWCLKIYNINNLEIKQMDRVYSPLEKVDCIINSQLIISQVCKLTDPKGNDAGQDDILPLFIYNLLKAAPKRLFSNLHFIKGFNMDPNNNKYNAYAQSTQTFESAIQFLDDLTHQHLKNISELDFQYQIHEKEVDLQIYFLQRRNRSQKKLINLDKIRKSNNIHQNTSLIQ